MQSNRLTSAICRLMKNPSIFLYHILAPLRRKREHLAEAHRENTLKNVFKSQKASLRHFYDFRSLHILYHLVYTFSLNEVSRSALVDDRRTIRGSRADDPRAPISSRASASSLWRRLAAGRRRAV